MPHIYKIHAMADGSRSSSPQNAQVTSSPAWKYWLLPSVADLIFVALLAVLVFTPLSVKLLGDAGIGWHIRTGQLILSDHAVPHEDPFSTQIHLPWFAWEWLYDVAAGKLEAWCGLNGVVWLTAVVVAAVFAWTFRLLLARGTNLFLALALILLAISASTIHFLARPHVLSWLFALAWFEILDSTERNGSSDRTGSGRRWLWVLPILMLLWANIHGGFVLGFVLVAIYWIGSFWTWLTRKESRIEESLERIAAGKRLRELTAVGLASLLASLINPYGWNLHAHIYSYLTNRFLMEHIDEFQSPNFHGLAPKCFLILLLLSVAMLIARGRALRPSNVLLALFAVYAGLYASRNIPVSSIFLVLIVGPLVSTGKPGAFAKRMTAIDSRLRGHVWPIVAAAATIMIAANGGRIGSSQWMDAHFDPKRMPVDAVNFLQQQGVQSAIFSPDNWGGYLIYRLYPHNKVVVDDRHDFYGEDFLQFYLTAIHLEPGWEVFLHARDCLLLPKRSPLSTMLLKMPGWKVVYSDDVAVVFMRPSEREDSDRFPNH
jgi:hypothetical protein